MADETFTEPDDTHDGWVDVRMTDPDEEEWDIDAVVVGGRVEYVDLRIQPALLTEFIECLVEDMGQQRAQRVVADVVDRTGLDIEGETDEEHHS